MWPETKIFKMALWPKAGLYQNAQSVSYLQLTLHCKIGFILKFIKNSIEQSREIKKQCH